MEDEERLKHMATAVVSLPPQSLHRLLLAA